VEADAGAGMPDRGCGIEDPGSKGADDWVPDDQAGDITPPTNRSDLALAAEPAAAHSWEATSVGWQTRRRSAAREVCDALVAIDRGAPLSLLRRILSDQRFRFLLVGGINVVQGIGWFAVLHALLGDALPYPLVLVLVYVVSIPIGFVLYRIFVFQVTGQWLTDFARFILIQAGAFAINLSALPFFHEILGLPLLASQALSIAVILLFSYAGHLYVSFRRRHDDHRQPDPWAGDPPAAYATTQHAVSPAGGREAGDYCACDGPDPPT
jgi:putative flippase GtrA